MEQIKKTNQQKQMEIGLDLTGKKFGNLTFLSPVGAITSKEWIYLCDCGNRLSFYRGNLFTRPYLMCRDCATKTKEQQKQKGREQKVSDRDAFEKMHFRSYKKGARERKIPFLLTIEQFRSIVSQPCFYCGIASFQYKLQQDDVYPHNGIDRINSSQGYIIDNVRPCCRQCNVAKSDLAEVDFYSWIERTHKHLTSQHIIS